MNTEANIVITGAAGFIGSCMVQYLNEQGFYNLILVDEFARIEKTENWKDKKCLYTIERNVFFAWLDDKAPAIDFIFHLGARTDTTEFDYAIHQALNVDYSISMWNYCVKNDVPLVYASSAATYGDGELGYSDDHDVVEHLKPLNAYGISKNEFDKWALKQQEQPPFWAGLKFFNVYGPNEYHKGRMASVIWHAFNQINAAGVVKLFRSHKDGYKDGEQLRDFVYVKDLLKVMTWIMLQMDTSIWKGTNNGLYNLGTGTARSFYALASATFAGLDQQPDIAFIDMPVDIRDKYQYFTEANMDKLRAAGYVDAFYSLEEGVNDYVRNYLAKGLFY